MKKVLFYLLSAVLAAGMLAAPVFAEENGTLIILQVGNPMMTVNGAEMEVDEGRGTTPIITNDRTLVPIRAIIEAMGGDVEWDEETQTVLLAYKADIITLEIDNTTAYVNDEANILDTAPVVINDRTMLPIRFIAEGFRFDVDWDETSETITITNDSKDIIIDGGVFGLGNQISRAAEKTTIFTGNVWLNVLTRVNEQFPSSVGNVSFAPCARTDWHRHPDGQILLVTGGDGYYQIEGEQAHEIKAGDAVLIDPGVMHWHGGGKNTHLNHIAVTVNNNTEWGEPVTEDEYNAAIENAIPSTAQTTAEPLEGSIFNLGRQISEAAQKSTTFTGDVWLNVLTAVNEQFPSSFGNVSFAPCARTDWHMHPDGQILLVTGGEGYVQLENEGVKVLHVGDVAQIEPGAMHWHGAAENGYFNHVAITINNNTEWGDPVTDEQYNAVGK